MSHIKILVDFRNKTEYHSWKISVQKETTVAQLQHKLRRFAKMKPEEACFLFFQFNGFLFKKEKLYGGNILLSDIQIELCMEVLEVKMILESSFGTFSKMFVKAKIEQRQTVFCAIITWSYMGLYHYDELSVHNTLHEATEHLLKVRCNGCLSLEKNET